MSAGQPFAVDLDELARVVAEMAACHADLTEVAGEIARQVQCLHESWSGEAATAHAAAQQAWDAGFGEMREALAFLHGVGETAHGNYAAAANANVDMWSQVSCG